MKQLTDNFFFSVIAKGMRKFVINHLEFKFAMFAVSNATSGAILTQVRNIFVINYSCIRV